MLKLTLLFGCFPGFLNCRNGTKSCNSSQIFPSEKDTGRRADIYDTKKRFTKYSVLDQFYYNILSGEMCTCVNGLFEIIYLISKVSGRSCFI